MTEPRSSVMHAIMAAWNTAAEGDRDGARRRYLELWGQLEAMEPAGRNPAEYCTLAHFLADVQDDAENELAWDRTALAIADGLTDSDRERWPDDADTIAGFYPSLYVNLAADCLKVNDPVEAREWFARAESTTHVLPNTDYGNMIRASIEWVSSQLG